MRGSLIEVSAGRRRGEQSSVFVLLRSSSGRINFLFIVFRLEYTVIKRPDGIRSRMPGNQSSLCIYIYIYIYINILFIRYFLFIILFLFFILFYETHIFIATFLFTLLSYFCFIFNQYLPILLMFTNIISFSFLLHPTRRTSALCFVWPFRATVLKINRNDRVVETQYSVTQNVMHKISLAIPE